MCSSPDTNWRKQNKTLSTRMKAILHQGLFTDVVFKVKDSTSQGEQEFNCHRLILAIGSPFFEKTFYHTFRNSELSPSPVVISDVTPEAFQCVLNFLYTDKVTFGNEKQAFDTYVAANKFQIPNLVSECEIYLSELDFRPWSIWNNLERANELEMEKLERKYWNYIQRNTLAVLTDDAFLNANGSAVKKVMQFDMLAISEVELVNRLVAWVKTKNPKFQKQMMTTYLRDVRFKAMTQREFSNLVKNHPNLLETDDCLKILQHLEHPKSINLPAWCCQLPRTIRLET